MLILSSKPIKPKLTPNYNQTMIKKLMTARRFIAAGVLSAFMFVGIASVNAQLSEGLIGYWPLDEGDGTTAAGTFSAVSRRP